MAILEISVLKEIIEKIHDDFSLEFNDRDQINSISDKVKIDMSGKKIIFKKY